MGADAEQAWFRLGLREEGEGDAPFFAERCGVDADEVWEWGYIERVSTGLLNLRDFGDNSGSGFLEVARRCL